MRTALSGIRELVADCIPVRRDHGSGCPGSLDVRLVEDGEDPVAVVSLALSVQVLLLQR